MDVRLTQEIEGSLTELIRDAIEFKVKGASCVGFNEEDATETCKNIKTNEWCPHCQKEVEISANGISKCPECGENILPCSMCVSCLEVCPYTAEYEMLCSFPEEDKDYCSEFYVPRKWLKKKLKKEQRSYDEFKETYTWDETYYLMLAAKKDGVYLSI